MTTPLGVLSVAELAPHLARRVLLVEIEIWQGQFAERVLDEALILDLHHRICGELVPEIAGRWRRVDVSVGRHEAPSFVRVGPLMRDYVLSLLGSPTGKYPSFGGVNPERGFPHSRSISRCRNLLI